MKNKDYRFYRKILKNIELITGKNKNLEEKILIGILEVLCKEKYIWNQKDAIIAREISKRLNKLGYDIEFGRE